MVVRTRNVTMVIAPEAPSQTYGSGTFMVTKTYNIRSGRNGGLESTLRAMVLLGVNIGFFRETKLTSSIYICNSGGYNVAATNVPRVLQGGVALFWKESKGYKVKEARIWAPNVLTFELVMVKDRYYVMGTYISPSDLTTLEHVENARRQCPKGCKPLLIGDLNVNLESPRDERYETIAEQVDTMDLVCMA